MKFIRNILNRFKSKPPKPKPEVYSLAQLFADAEHEIEKENAMIVQLLQAEWEEDVLTAGRDVTRLPPCRTLQ